METVMEQLVKTSVWKMPRIYVLMIFLMIKWIYTLWVFESRVLQCLHDQMIRYQIEVMAPSIVFKITPKALKLNSLRFLNFSFYLLDPFKKISSIAHILLIMTASWKIAVSIYSRFLDETLNIKASVKPDIPTIYTWNLHPILVLI